MTETRIQTIRSRAREHQEELASLRWFTPQRLAARWDIAESTVREIPFDDLPYREFGKKGTKKPRRRYKPEDVAAFEAKSGRAPIARESVA